MSARKVAEFFVPGVPVPQGSKTAFVVGKRAVVADSNRAALKPWRAVIADAARSAHAGAAAIEGAVQVELTFQMPRGKTVRRDLPSVKPDLDKLTRALFDGITDAGVWKDDSQVVTALMRKVYAEEPGIRVVIGEYVTPNPKEREKK